MDTTSAVDRFESGHREQGIGSPFLDGELFVDQEEEDEARGSSSPAWYELASPFLATVEARSEMATETSAAWEQQAPGAGGQAQVVDAKTASSWRDKVDKAVRTRFKLTGAGLAGRVSVVDQKGFAKLFPDAAIVHVLVNEFLDPAGKLTDILRHAHKMDLLAGSHTDRSLAKRIETLRKFVADRKKAGTFEFRRLTFSDPMTVVETITPRALIAEQVAGFATAHADRAQRRVLVQTGSNVETMVHEACHFYMHPKFRAMADGKASTRSFIGMRVSEILIEGFAEHFARQVMRENEPAFGPLATNAYQGYVEAVGRFVATTGDETARKAFFGGTTTDLNRLFKAVEANIDSYPLLVPGFALETDGPPAWGSASREQAGEADEEPEGFAEFEDYAAEGEEGEGRDELDELDELEAEDPNGLADMHETELEAWEEADLEESEAAGEDEGAGETYEWDVVRTPIAAAVDEADELHEAFAELNAELDAEEEGGAAPPAGVSPLAVLAHKQWDAQDRPKQWQGRVYGLVVHTTGGGLPSSARAQGLYHTVRAVNHYNQSHGCHYVNGWRGIDGGDLLQIANEREQANGVGVTNTREPGKDQRRSIDGGRFETDLPPILVKLWRARWPGYQHSLALLPGTRTANACYVHVECVPCVYHHDKKLRTDAPPLREGLRFTRAQHDAVALLACDIARRNGWPMGETWWRTPRLVGHEDLTPISRHDRNGGWDPGSLRERPYFDWPSVYEAIERIQQGGAGGPKLPAAAQPGLSVLSVLGDAARRFGDLVARGQEVVALSLAYQRGIRDLGGLTNLVFFARHPELGGRKIGPDEQGLAKEWLTIRDTVVKAALATLTRAAGSGAPTR